MLFLLSYLLLFSAAITGLLLVVDLVYSRVGADRRIDPGGRRWMPDAVLADEPDAEQSLLPPGLRSRAWLGVLGLFVLGTVLLVLAS